jgi:hypothetical protein
MLELLLVIGRALALALRGHGELVLENLALWQQLTAMKRTTSRPHLQARDRLFWIVSVSETRSLLKPLRVQPTMSSLLSDGRLALTPEDASRLRSFARGLAA